MALWGLEGSEVRLSIPESCVKILFRVNDASTKVSKDSCHRVRCRGLSFGQDPPAGSR